MRDHYISALYDLAKNDRRIMAVVADIGAIVYDKYREDLPDQFLNVGLCEQNMIGVAAGLAACEQVPFTYTITPFSIMRNYEQIRDDVCLQNSNVKMVGVGAGLRYSTLGPTHHATEDIAIMKVLPNLTIVGPADPIETEKAVPIIAEHEGPVYLRIGTKGEPEIYDKDYEFTLGEGVELKEGRDVTIVSTGSITYDVLEAAKELEKENISARVINIHTIKPMDKEIIIKAAKETGTIITVEEHQLESGFGSSVGSIILEECNNDVKFKRMGINDVFCSFYGKHPEIKEHYGLSKKDIIREAENLVNKS